VNVRLQYTAQFTAGVHYHDRLIMNNYTFRAYMVTNVVESEQTNTAFERLKYFIDEEMASTVFINSENIDACQRYLAAGMNITTLPNEPVDQIVGVMLFHKLNAIMEERISIIEVECSSQLGDNMIYIHSENEVTNDLVLPDWWTTADVVHCDTNLIDSDNVLSLLRSNVWRELDLAWPIEATLETGNIVFADFGKDDTKH
jgi:hypothetical protein